MKSRIGQIARVGAGQSAPQDPSAFSSVGTPFVRAGSLEFLCRGVSVNELERINDQQAKKQRMKLYPAGTILFAKSGMSAVQNRVYILPIPAHVVSHLATIEVKNGVDPQFLAYFWKNFKTSRLIQDPAYPSISLEAVNDVEIELPGESEQKRIAAILDKADRLRRQRRFAQTLSDSFLQSVFIKMFGDSKSNPFGWDELPFEEVCEIEAKLVDPRKPIYQKLFHIGGDNIEALTGELKGLKTVAKVKPISSKFLITPRHILFSKIRPKLRKVSFPNMDALCSADIYPLSVKPTANTEFLIHYLRGEHFSRIVSNLAETRTNIPKVNRDELAELRIPSPPLALQEKFAAIVRKFERIRRQQREATRQAEHLFQTLLHRAFRGEL